jgi:hypothetical protein
MRRLAAGLVKNEAPIGALRLDLALVFRARARTQLA